MTTFVIVPTYNEADNLRPLAEQVLAQPGVTALVVVDDGSPDGTGRIARELAEETEGRVQVLERPGKLGLGSAYRAGLTHALAAGAERVITMDADFSHPPAAIPALLAASVEHELVIGSRYVPGGRVELWGLHRRALSKVANQAARTALGLAARDCTAGFRCYQAELLRRVDVTTIRSSDYAFLVEMLFACQSAGASVAEVPITFVDRRQGASKISQREIWRAMKTVARLAGGRWRDRAGARWARQGAGPGS